MPEAVCPPFGSILVHLKSGRDQEVVKVHARSRDITSFQTSFVRIHHPIYYYAQGKRSLSQSSIESLARRYH